MTLFIEQCLNGLQFGLLLFLLAAGLTLVFGIMDLVNLAHGSLYMIGAYFAATFAAWTGSFVLGAVLALVATLMVGMAVEVIAMRRLYGRDHLDHVLGTFGLILFFDELVRLIWGPEGMSLPLPSWLNTSVQDSAGRAIFRLPALHHRGHAGGRGISLCAGDAHAHRHADPRRRVQPRNGRRARRQHQAALHAGVRARRRARRPRRADAGADPDRADRHGREHSHSRLRHHGDRRHRLDPRRFRGGDPGRLHRHGRALLFARSAAPGAEPRTRRRPRRRRCRPC